jgi:tetratricopeptide (TPR) repeat protein
MAKIQNKPSGVKQSGRQLTPPAAQQPKPENSSVSSPKEGKGWRPSVHMLYAGGVALLTWLFLQVCTTNQLTNWDDPGYIKDNPYIKDLSPEGLQQIFTVPIMGNYHPLTILSYAIEYSYVRLEPWLYHLDSLLFHIIVTLLVYWFVQLLTRRPIAAAITALLFGLHPMHIESVAWLAGRKDVVYGLFYMAACVAYVYYLRAEGARRIALYIGVALLFICSLLGKPVAVVLPVTLLLIDYFERRKLTFVVASPNEGSLPGEAQKTRWNYAILVEKIPLFLISLYFGYRSIKDQKTFGSLDADNIAFNFLERIALGAYAFFTYLWKAIAPVQLCNFYPYPLKVNGALPGIYYIYPVIGAAIIAAAWFFGRKNRVVIFGSLFFLVNIVLLLQFLPVGGAIIADRYSYIPYLGLFFMAGWLVSGLLEPGRKKALGYVALGAVLAYSLTLGYLSNERCKVWYDTTTLWRDEIEKEPRNAPNAWNNLGFNYFNKFNESVNPAERKVFADSSAYFLTEAIRIQPTFVNPYISLGELQRSMGNFNEAKKYYYKALSLPMVDEGPNAYLGLAIIYAITHNFDSSAYCFREAVTKRPHFPEAHSNYGNFFDMTHQPDSALVHYAISIAQNPDIYAPHLNRGRLLFRLKRYDEAMKDFETCLSMVPNNGEVYYARSFVYFQKGNKAQALQDAQKAVALGYAGVDNNYLQTLKSR